MNDLKIQTIEEFVLAGLLSRFKQVFECPVIYGNSQDKVKIVEKLFEGRPVVYPYAFLEIGTISQNNESYSTNVMARQGIRTFIKDSGNAQYQVRLIPANFEVSVFYVTNEMLNREGKSIMEFTRRWLFARRSGYLKFNIDYGDLLSLRIGTTLADNVVIPSLENKTEQASAYELTAQMTVHGFVSEPVLNSVGIVQEVEINEEVKSTNGSFWSF